MNLLVIHEKDYSDNENSVIGVCDSLEKANELINEYYGGQFKELSYTDIRDSNLEYSKLLEVYGVAENYKVKITLEWFQLNKL